MIKSITAVEYIKFIFNPNFNQGDHSGVFRLVMRMPGEDTQKITSAVQRIYELDGSTCVETCNSTYKLVEIRRKPRHLTDVKAYLDGELTTRYIYDHCVANQFPSREGWTVY